MATLASMGRKLIAAVRTAIAVPFYFLATLGFALVLVVISIFKKDAPAIERTLHAWSRGFLRLAPMTFEVAGSELIDRHRQYVFVANHLSNFDIPLLFLAIPKPIRYLAKKEVYKIPVVAQAMKAVGIIKIDRWGTTTSHTSINAGIADARRRGYSLIIFPEETRQIDGNLSTFKKGAFRIAIDNQLPVVPVTIQGSWEVWKPGAKVIYPGHGKVVIHEPIETAHLGLSDIEDLRERVHGVIGKTFENLGG